MGCKNSKKVNKDIEKQKLCKVGLGLGRNNLKVEGNFQIGYHSKTDKKYSTMKEKFDTDCVDGKSPTNLPTKESITDCVDGKFSTDLATIHEEEEENG